MPHLELKNLTQRFGSQTALDGLNLSIEKGELISLLGPSGCGKTTTIRLIAGFLEPSRGSVWIDGRDVTPLPTRAAQYRDGISVLCLVSPSQRF